MKDFLILNNINKDIIYDIRYYSNYNFVGNKIDGYEKPYAILTKEAAEALKKINDELLTKGYCLKIFDAYRPVEAVNYFIKWTYNTNNDMKKYFYPNVNKEDLIKKGYISSNSSHSRGSTVDLTIVNLNTNQELDMGGTFDYFDKLSHVNYKNITKEQYSNRMFLHNIMLKYGFNSLEEEWWHFTLNNEPYPNTYFDFKVDNLL